MENDSEPTTANLDLDEAESLLTGDFGKQFGGSAAANIVTLLLLGIFMGLKKLCNRPSRCKSHLHCPCLDVNIMDRSNTEARAVPESVDQARPGEA